MTEHHTQGAKILAFVGLPGAGKTEATDYVVAKGYPKVYAGGIMYDEMRKEGIEITPESQMKFREEWRQREGKDVIIKRAAEQMRHLLDAGQHTIIFDGLYTWTEYKYLKHEFPGELITVAITASKHLRHHRLNIRPERPFTEEEANQRDWSEIENLEKGGPIAIADYFIHNDSSVSTFRERIDQLLDEIKFRD